LRRKIAKSKVNNRGQGGKMREKSWQLKLRLARRIQNQMSRWWNLRPPF